VSPEKQIKGDIIENHLKRYDKQHFVILVDELIHKSNNKHETIQVLLCTHVHIASLQSLVTVTRL